MGKNKPEDIKIAWLPDETINAIKEAMNRVSKELTEASKGVNAAMSGLGNPVDPATKMQWAILPHDGTVGLTNKHYLVCNEHKSAVCTHVQKILATYKDDVAFFERTPVITRDKRGKYPIQVSAVPLAYVLVDLIPGSDTDDSEVKYARVEITHLNIKYDLGFIQAGLEGFGTITELVQNWLRYQVMSSAKCKSSSHWKWHMPSKNIDTYHDAASWMENGKCLKCEEYSRDLMKGTVPEREAQFPKPQSAGPTPVPPRPGASLRPTAITGGFDPLVNF